MQQRRPQAWRTRPAHRQAHRRPTARDPAAAATSANLPQKAAHTATGGASGRNRSRSPVMGPDVGLRGARRRPHGGHRSGWTGYKPWGRPVIPPQLRDEQGIERRAQLSTASRGRNTRLRTYLTPRDLRKALACAFTANKRPMNAPISG